MLDLSQRNEAAMSQLPAPASPQTHVTGRLARDRSDQRSAVVVGVDDTAAGYLALEQAAAEADLRHCALQVVHVQEPVRDEDGFEAVRSGGAGLLSDAVNRAHLLRPGIEVQQRLAVGAPRTELLAAAYDAELLVVGAHSRSTFGNLVAGSVASYVATHATCPVMVVRIPARPATNGVGRQIVVGVDGSPGSHAALNWAIDEAALRDSELIALHAGPEDPQPDPLRTGPLTPGRRLGVRVRRMRVGGDPRAALIAASVDAAAIVVGARGRGGFRGLISGSVTQALIGRAYSPLFVVRAAG
jgi:nucleotide-binding universal stress UspA family protein